MTCNCNRDKGPTQPPATDKNIGDAMGMPMSFLEISVGSGIKLIFSAFLRMVLIVPIVAFPELMAYLPWSKECEYVAIRIHGTYQKIQ